MNPDETAQDWFTDEAFWRTFGPLMFGPDQFTEAEQQIEQLLQLLELESEAETRLRALDLGAGPGRHSLPLARAGFDVTAVDTSGYLLDQLQPRAREEGLDISIVQQDMRHYEQRGHFDLALVMWTSFGYFEDEDDHREVLKRIFNSLVSGGRLVLDLVGLEYLCRNLEPVHLTETEDGRTLIERPVLAEDLTRLDNEWILIETGDDGNEVVHRQHFSHRVWSAGEIRLWLEQAGFNAIEILADCSGGEYNLDAERQIVLATKP